MGKSEMMLYIFQPFGVSSKPRIFAASGPKEASDYLERKYPTVEGKRGPLHYVEGSDGKAYRIKLEPVEKEGIGD